MGDLVKDFDYMMAEFDMESITTVINGMNSLKIKLQSENDEHDKEISYLIKEGIWTNHIGELCNVVRKAEYNKSRIFDIDNQLKKKMALHKVYSEIIENLKKLNDSYKPNKDKKRKAEDDCNDGSKKRKKKDDCNRKRKTDDDCHNEIKKKKMNEADDFIGNILNDLDNDASRHKSSKMQ